MFVLCPVGSDLCVSYQALWEVMVQGSYYDLNPVVVRFVSYVLFLLLHIHLPVYGMYRRGPTAPAPPSSSL